MNRQRTVLVLFASWVGLLVGCSGSNDSNGDIMAIGGTGANGSGTATSGGASSVFSGTSTLGGGGSTVGGGATSAFGGGSAINASDCGSVKWPCWPMPTLGSPNGAHSTANYTANGDGTVTDNTTGLIWQQALLTNVYSSTSVHTGAWDEAIAACSALGNGWRLPTRIELTSIVNYSNTPTAMDTVFSNDETATYTYTGSGWWVSILVASKPQYTWIFALKNGVYSGFTSNAGARDAINNVRCVKGTNTGEGPLQGAVAPANHYTLSGGEVKDNFTGLIWQQGISDSKLSWEDAKTYCSSLGLNGQTWRLPAIHELSTLVDEAAVSPAIDEAAFPNTPCDNSGTIVDVATKTVTEEGKDWFWSSQPVRGSSTLGWGLNFMDGFTTVQDITTVLKQNTDGTYSIRFNYWTTAWAKCVR